MPKRRGNFQCTVPLCENEWMYASVRRLQYCDIHFHQALSCYNSYKSATKKAISTFSDEDLDLAISLRQKYDDDFIKGDRGSHYSFILLLLNVRNSEFSKRKSLYNDLIESFFKY